jgi:hypothetical protein
MIHFPQYETRYKTNQSLFALYDSTLAQWYDGISSLFALFSIVICTIPRHSSNDF